MKNCLCKFLVVISSLILVVTAASSVKAKDEIKIGALYPLTGSMALLGNHDMNGVELATDIINERGGIKGKKVLLIKGDASTPEAGRSEAERLINVENLNVIFGTYSSSLSYVASSVAEKHKRIYWETGAIADNITQRISNISSAHAKRRATVAMPQSILYLISLRATSSPIKIENLHHARGLSLGTSVMVRRQND